MARGGGGGAQSDAPSTALAIMLNRFCTVDGPLSGPDPQNGQKLVEEGSVSRGVPGVARLGSREGRARSTRGGWRRSPDPTDASAQRNSPRAGPRSLPSSAWIGFALLTVDLLKKARSW